MTDRQNNAQQNSQLFLPEQGGQKARQDPANKSARQKQDKTRKQPLSER